MFLCAVRGPLGSAGAGVRRAALQRGRSGVAQGSRLPAASDAPILASLASLAPLASLACLASLASLASLSISLSLHPSACPHPSPPLSRRALAQDVAAHPFPARGPVLQRRAAGRPLADERSHDGFEAPVEDMAKRGRGKSSKLKSQILANPCTLERNNLIVELLLSPHLATRPLSLLHSAGNERRATEDKHY